MKKLRFRTLVSLVMAVVAVQVVPFGWESDQVVSAAGWLTDDAFFYAVIAEHLHQRGALEFYPGMETNGFQPLWMAAVAVAHTLVPSVTALEWIRYLSVVAFGGFALLAMVLMWRDDVEAKWAAAVFSGLVLLNPEFQAWVLNGLETALALTVFAATMLQAWRVEKMGARPTWLEVVALAVFGALCFLARTDLFVVSAVLAVWMIWRCGLGRRVAIFVAVTAACVVPYLVWNWVHFGVVVPLSGQAQQFYLSTYHGSLGSYLGSEQWQGIFYAFFHLIPGGGGDSGGVMAVVEAATIAVPIGAAYAAFGKPRFLGDGALAHVLRLFLVVAAAHLAVMYGYHRGVRPFAAYYFAPSVVVSCMIVAVAGVRTVRRSWWPGWSARRRTRVLAIATVAALLWLGMAGWQTALTFSAQPDPFWEQRVELSADIDEAVGEKGTVGAYWPGALANFSDHDVIPLDGVIASAEYQDEVMRSKEAMDYLCHKPDPYLAVYLLQSLEMWREIDEEPHVPEWMWAHRLEMWRHGMEHFEEVERRPAGEEPGGWYLLRVDPCS